MKKILLSLAIFLSSLFMLNAQDYENALGLRAGLATGITLKHFFSTSDAVEGILSMRYGGFNVTGLYERHMTAFDTEGLYFYYGGGGHIGFYDTDRWDDDDENDDAVMLIGVDGIIGLEYIFEEIPFNISLDWKPAINLIGHTNFYGDELALSFRYIF
jgi:hypothetical protein